MSESEPLPPRRFFHGKPCPYCGDLMTKRGLTKATKDHKLPRSRGGMLTAKNRLIVCIQCNQDKGNRTLEAWLACLRLSGDVRVGLVASIIETDKLFS